MKDLNKILLQAIAQALDEGEIHLVENITNELNLFEIVDSFSIVNILLESESLLEIETGNYVTLADENMFDAEKTPFRSWSGWVAHVKAKHGI